MVWGVVKEEVEFGGGGGEVETADVLISEHCRLIMRVTSCAANG